jgi:hypothetical protein
MPICPRCGKSLTSDQALNYHLNRKFRCGIWNCTRCNVNFNTKHQLQLHEIQCGDTDNKHNHPSTDTLLTIYNNFPLAIIEFDEDTKKILSISPQGKQFFQNVVGANLNEIIKNHKQNEIFVCKNICIVSC